MKRIRKRKRTKKATKRSITKRKLRRGSKRIKKLLLEENPKCDICGSTDELQLHHVFLIRHGFETRKDRCRLLCAKCHRLFHKKYDKYLDVTFRENPLIDFNKIYDVLKNLMLSGSQ